MQRTLMITWRVVLIVWSLIAGWALVHAPTISAQSCGPNLQACPIWDRFICCPTECPCMIEFDMDSPVCGSCDPTPTPGPTATPEPTPTADAYTVHVAPSAGCTVFAADGGIDVVETPNGIVCSGMTAANDPLCTEQFKNFNFTMLKVVTDPGYAFTGWTVNGVPAKRAAGPLVLTTGTGLVGMSGVLPGGTAEVQANCFSVTITAPDTVKRDEMFDVTLTLNPPPLWEKTTVTFDLAGQKTQHLPGRGDVQMYDFGYDTDNDRNIESGQTTYTFNSVVDGGTKTIKAVYNLYQPPQAIKVLASVGGQTFESSPIAVTYQVRQYTTQYNNATVNDYDALITYWVDYWTHWHYPNEQNPYTFKATNDVTHDLIKAICYKESTMKQKDLMSVLAWENTLQTLRGPKVTPRDWNWSATPDANGQYILEKEEAVDPPQDLSNAGAVFMKYSFANVTSASGSVQWGVRWFYSKRSKYTGYDPRTGNAYNPQWFNIEDTVDRFGDQTATYKDKIMNLYNYGKNPNLGDPGFLWPIKTNAYPRD